MGHKKENEEGGQINFLEIEPSFSHLAIGKLYEMGKVKKVITSNVDFLHNRANKTNKDILNLHGDVCTEYCDKCGTEYHRDYEV